MPGDSHKPVRAGELIRIGASVWNALVRSLAGPKGSAGGGAGPQVQPTPQNTIALVVNSSAHARDRFAVAGIDSVIITPSANLKAFQNAPVLEGITPATKHAGRFAIFTAPAEPYRIVPAVVAGVSVVQIDMQDADDLYADVLDGDHTQLQSGKSGSAHILWVEAGTGTKWAVVRIGSQPLVDERIAAGTGIYGTLDKWIDVTQATGGTYIDDAGDDWRGRAIWYSVRLYRGTPADADPDEFDDDNADYQDVRCAVVGYDWDSDADDGGDIVLWSDAGGLQTDLVLEEDTGRLYVRVSWGGIRHQLRITVQATAVKRSIDAGVPDITI